MLVNPYGTNTTGLYIWFETVDPFTVSYTIHADGYPDFSRTLSSEPTTEHEYQIIGMVPSALNTITLELTDSAGGVSSFSFEQQAPALLRGESFTTLEVTEGTSTQELGDTLYTMLGPQEKATFTYQPYTCAYDAAGVARMEIPLVNYRTERQTFANDLMYYNISYNTIVGVNSLGKMVERFDLNHYSMHHDYTLGGDNDLLVLATRDDDITTEDRIVRVDLAICWGRSYDFSADPCYWDTGYDWFEDAIGNAGTPELNSYYYKYLVDENAGTFSLVESIPVSYSGYISSVEDIGSTKVICSGIATETVILDENNELIQSMTSDYDYWWYRVFGYDYSGFWFA